MRIAIGIILGITICLFILLTLLYFRLDCCCGYSRPLPLPPTSNSTINTIPEPSTVALLAIGAGALAFKPMWRNW